MQKEKRNTVINRSDYDDNNKTKDKKFSFLV
jgi:hypothetical protein